MSKKEIRIYCEDRGKIANELIEDALEKALAEFGYKRMVTEGNNPLTCFFVVDDEVKQAEETRMTMCEILEFYADEHNYLAMTSGRTNISVDGGRLARQVLSRRQKGDKENEYGKNTQTPS